MDRVIYGSYHIPLTGESLRKTKNVGTKTGHKSQN